MVIDRYESADALAKVTRSPVEVCRLIFALGVDREGVSLIRSDGRDMITCEQRHAISWVARDFIGATYEQIGRALNLDHSVIVRGYNRARLLRKLDPEFRQMSDQLARTVQRVSPRRQMRLL